MVQIINKSIQLNMMAVACKPKILQVNTDEWPYQVFGGVDTVNGS
jgi:hypothetical protein